MSNELIIEESRGCRIVRFARPEIRSPLSISVLEQLHSVVDGTAADGRIQSLIFTGIDDVFASGADLREIAAVDTKGAREFALRGQTLMSKISGLPQMTVAAVNGFCFGGAFDLTLACDHRIASPSAVFSHPGASLGIITGWGGTQRLPRLIGQANAFEMFFTASPITAARALKIGLIDEISNNPLESAIKSLET